MGLAQAFTPPRRLAALAVASLVTASLVTNARAASTVNQVPVQAGVRSDSGASTVREFADWAVAAGDNQGLPFAIVDKRWATVSVFYPDGRIRGVGPALLGLARGDDSVAGIGDRSLSTIRPEERTTPAGRFMAALGQDLGNEDVLWVDYEAAISLHRVFTGNPKERRTERLDSPTISDNRISYGCINVPVKFYEADVRPAFASVGGVVYILPELRSMRDVFPTFRTPDAEATGQPSS